MKICDITMFYAPVSGGVKTYIHRKADFVTRRRGWSHIAIVPGAENAVIEEGLFRIYTVKGPLVPAHHPYRFLLNPWRVGQILRAEAPDLIELGSAYFLPWVLQLAMPRPRPVLTGFYHDDFPSTYVRGYGQPLGAFAARAAEALAWAYARAVYRRCDLVLAGSGYVAEKLSRHGIGHVRRVSLGVNLQHFRPDRRSSALRARLGVKNEKVLLYVGRLSYEKGVAPMLAAFERLPADGYRLVMAGDGPERPAVEAFAATHKNVVYLGYCADPDALADLYASCDLFLAPGPHETFGLTVLEAFASGLPAVGANRGAVAELIAAGAGVTVDPDDPADFAAQIAGMCAGDLRAIGLRARARIEGPYAWESTFGAFADIYQELVAAHRESVCPESLSSPSTT